MTNVFEFNGEVVLKSGKSRYLNCEIEENLFISKLIYIVF